jgi:hypothetical protein
MDVIYNSIALELGSEGVGIYNIDNTVYAIPLPFLSSFLVG